ncbi:MAG: FAD-dependent oxidoreductase [Methylobacteriaceae bacterium]|nr:FAD-dependent oxidoreductase [Methylobacteriaceae bacterium]
MASQEPIRFPYRTPPELSGNAVRRVPVAIVGAGPVGLAAAIDLALHGVPSVVLDDNDTVSTGSRAICWAKRTLEIFDRLGVGDRMVAKGVTWQRGRVFRGEREIYAFDLLPEGGHKMPAFINLQQYYVEEYLVARCADFPELIDLRWRNRVAGVAPHEDGVRLAVETPDGSYGLEADWVVAADGARSALRTMLGLPFAGQDFEERFLIADVRMQAPFPNERLFWFEPTFHPGQSALLHRQPDDVFRIDFQLGPEADPIAERAPDRVIPRVQAVVGPDTPFELEWCSVYAFRCARLERFVHGRVVFAGDSAHVVSPFGARGGNGGIQDVDNLAWKLARVVRSEAPVALVESYEAERGHGADENILNSARTTTFMTPKSAAEMAFRDAVLTLAPDHAFARALVNAGRLSRPCSLATSALQTPDDGTVAGPMAPGLACLDAPLADLAGRPTWLLAELGHDFVLLAFPERGADRPAVPGCRTLAISTEPREGAFHDRDGLAAARYGGAPGVTYLIRPDQHVAARWSGFDPAAVAAALARFGLSARPADRRAA